MVEAHEFEDLFVEGLGWGRPDREFSEFREIPLEDKSTEVLAKLVATKSRISIWHCRVLSAAPADKSPADKKILDMVDSQMSGGLPERIAVFTHAEEAEGGDDGQNQLWVFSEKNSKGNVIRSSIRYESGNGGRSKQLPERLLEYVDFKSDNVGAYEVLKRVRELFETRRAARAAKDLTSSIIQAVSILGNQERQKIAEALVLPHDKKDKGAVVSTYDSAAKIGSILLANAMMFHGRLQAEHIVLSIKSLQVCLESGKQARNNLKRDWKEILEVDYFPIFEPALKVLEALPDNEATGQFLTGLGECVGRMLIKTGGFESDFVGKLYHSLLETARYDGSFYTSVPAGFLLAKLALPEDMIDWGDVKQISKLKICDPSCGTGTLLLAAKTVCTERFKEAKGKKEPSKGELDKLHKAMAEEVIHGLDINYHAAQLAASMIAMSNPRVDFDNMNIYRVPFGVEDGKAWLGSLSLLEQGGETPSLAFADSARLGGGGDSQDFPDLLGQCDLVIMNPPFTRDSLRYDQMPREEELAMKKAEKELFGKYPDGDVVHLSSGSGAFMLLASELCSVVGRVSSILPYTVFNAASGAKIRKFFAEKFDIELIITSHDPKRIYFSENTTITEGMIVAKRKSQDDVPAPKTRFINLHNNPDNISDAVALADAIATGEGIQEYGSIQEWPAEKMQTGDWLPALFCNSDLTDAMLELRENEKLTPFGEVADIGPHGRRIHDAFEKSESPHKPENFMALWRHETDKRNSMQVIAKSECDSISPTKDDLAKKYWGQRSPLLLASRYRVNLTRSLAVFVDQAVLGSAWVPVNPKKPTHNSKILKAWCAWLNSTPTAIFYLSLRSRDLTYPVFSLDRLRAMQVPNPDKIGKFPIDTLAGVFDKLKDSELLPLPKMEECDTRKELDEAVCKAIGLDLGQVETWRKAICAEPTVHAGRN